jgi:DNA processing protein
LDIVYPSINIRLRDNILEHGGLLISEYAPGEKPVGWHFPFRNRIITGLAKALIVIEAKIRSGTMTSVQHALDQGKDIFVYPGDPASPFFEGNHLLLREGAQYFTTAMDILEDLGWLDNPEIIGQNSVCSGRAIKPSTPEEETVLSALSPGKLSFEQIAERCDLAPATLLSTLTMLQIKGAIEALPGKLYQINDSKS